MRFPTSLAAIVAIALAAAPAQAGGLPPLDLKAGQGSVGIGALSIGGDVAVADGLTVGAFAYNALLYWNLVTVRAAWAGPAGPYGTLGLTATGGMAFIAGNFAGTRNAPMLLAGPIFETPPYWVRLRASLQAGLLAEPRPEFDTGQVAHGYGSPYGPPVLLADRTITSLALLPGIEVVFPLGRHAELTLLGYNLAGVYARW